MASGGFQVYTDNQLHAMRVVDLKQYLTALRLPTSGNKNTLIARVLEFYDDNHVPAASNASSKADRNPRLLTHAELQDEISRLQLELTKKELELEISQLQDEIDRTLARPPAPVLSSTGRHAGDQATQHGSTPQGDSVPSAGQALNGGAPPAGDGVLVGASGGSIVRAGVGGAPSTDMRDVMKVFADSVSLLRLPTSEPPVFSGDAIQYPDWSRAFKAMIETKAGLSEDDKMYFLRRYVSGAALEAIDGFIVGDCYTQAKKLLDERYGDTYLIAEAYRNKLDSWPKLPRSEFSKALRKLSDFLVKCEAAMLNIPELGILNDSHQNQNIVRLLPDQLITKWNTKVVKFKKNQLGFPTFAEFVVFMKNEAELACHPTTSLEVIKSLSRPSPGKPAVSHSLTSSGRSSSFQGSSDSLVRSASRSQCLVCNGSHSVHECSGFRALSLSERASRARSLKLCFLCLHPGHQSRKCPKNLKCRTCKGAHNTLLHRDKEQEVQVSKPEEAQSSNCAKVKVDGVQSVSRLSSMVVPVWLSSRTNPSFQCLTYALLDSQSDTTFVTEELAQAVNSHLTPATLRMTTMTSKDKVVKCQKALDLTVLGLDRTAGKAINLPPAYTRSCIPHCSEHVPSADFASRWSHLKPIVSKFPPLEGCSVGLLIGYNCSRALMPLEVLRGDENQPYGVCTPLGWSIVGGVIDSSSDEVDDVGYSHRVTCHAIPSELRLSNPQPQFHTSDAVVVAHRSPIVEQKTEAGEVLKLLEGDFCLPGDKGLDETSQDDKLFLNILEGQICKDEKGYYTMPLPFKFDKPTLPNNRPVALRRFRSLEAKLSRDPGLRDKYHGFMQELLDANHAEIAPQLGDEVWYLPHHAVFNPSKPEKIRVVFDASSKFKGLSLNQNLLSGPDLNNSLVGVLCRFRRQPVAISCDIAKMFHQFKVNRSHRDFLRFLWYSPDGRDIIDYRMTVHVFGASSSPGCAKFGLLKLAADNQLTYPQAASFIKRSFYVDDGLISVATVEEAVQLLKETTAICYTGNLHVHKLLSNHLSVLEAFPTTDWSSDLEVADLSKSSPLSEKMLGVRWSIRADEFWFASSSRACVSTRRGMLSSLASLFDPLGFLSPFVLAGKLILQHVTHNCRWDEPLPDEAQDQWNSWFEQISQLSSLSVSRCVIPRDFGKVVSSEIHVFADASQYAYGACCYLRSVNEVGRVWCVLLFAKSRVVPLRQKVTIPRLELQAALLAAKIGARMAAELELESQVFFYSDSKIVLGYLLNTGRRYHTFVSNRISRIRELSTMNRWFHVSGEVNPADLASRGGTPKQLLASRWLKGPEFIWEPQLLLQSDAYEVSDRDPEVKTVAVSHRIVQSHGLTLVQLVDKFSRWEFIRGFVVVLYNVVKLRFRVDSSVLTYQRAEEWLLSQVQLQGFPDELEDLKSEGMVSKSSPLRRLDPFLGEDGLIHVGGRLRHSDLEEVEKHPIVLDGTSHIARVLAHFYHKKIGHQGRGTTLAALRSAGYWLLKGRSVVSSVIHHCVSCRSLRRPLESQKMADLPPDRTAMSAPFSYVGCDCFGPIMIKEGRKTLKKYGLIFTCLSSRAVHLELLDDLSTDAFINSIRCLFALRGSVRQIRCDRGSNFVGAAGELQRAFQELPDSNFKDFLRRHHCDFVFNSPGASHMGGAWERLIRSVRSVLQGILLDSHTRLDSSSARTLLFEVMSLINSRPLSSFIDHDEEPLTPNHLLHLKSGVILPPPGNFESADAYCRKRWRRVQYLVNVFWGKWKSVYLSSLQERSKWLDRRRNVSVGDVVLLKEGLSAGRGDWRVARVEEVFPSQDGLVRRVRIRLGAKGPSPSTTLERPVSKLVVLVENE